MDAPHRRRHALSPAFIAAILLFVSAVCVAASEGASGGEKSAFVYEVGVGFLSAPHGDNVPFAEEGLGVTAEFLYVPVHWAAGGVEVGWHAAGFDRDAFLDDIGGGDGSKLSSSAYTMFDTALMIRLEPIDFGNWQPFLSGGISVMNWHEEYSYDDQSWGPWFPSGTLVEADRSIKTRAGVVGGGLRYEGEARVGFVVEAQELFASGDDIDGRWTRLRLGVSWRR